jgi:hypothetical protein
MRLQGLTSKVLLTAKSAAATANATGSWIDVTDAEGDISIAVNTGAITGAIVWTVEHATDSGGTGGAAFTPDDGAFGTVSADTIQRRTINAGSINGFIRVVGTITTGPVLVAASVAYQPDQPAGSV